MSLDKAIKYGKEKRKPYIDSKAVDYSCRNHGSCGWCRNNRLYKYKRTEDKFKHELKENNLIEITND